MTTSAIDISSIRTARRLPRWLWWSFALLLFAALAAAALFAVVGEPAAPSAHANLSTFQVARGPLLISVSESGNIRSRDQIVIKSEVEGRTTILYLIPEGTAVKQGDLLAELDSSRLQDEQVDQNIKVQNAYADFIRARENLEVVKNQTASDVAKAELDHRFAQLNQTRYVEGDYPQQLQQAETEITLADEDVKRSTDVLDWSIRLAAEGYITQTDLQKDELAHKRNQLTLQLAQGKLQLLKQYTHLQRLEELQSEIEQTAMALERVRRKASADIVQAEAEFAVKSADLERQKSRLEKLGQQIAKTKIYAPAEGLVVYATTGQSGFRSTAEPLAEGQELRERQEIITLPTTNSMTAHIKLHESTLDKVRVGLPVRLTIDALPGRAFFGRLARISPLPDAQSVWMNPDLKVYHTEIHIDGDTTGLRTGMSTKAEIIVEEHPDAVYIPVQSVIRVAGQPTVFIPTPSGIQQRPVTIGLDNNSMVHVLDGLAPGEHVLMSPPLDLAGMNPTRTDEIAPAQPASQSATPAPQSAAPAPAAPAPDAAAPASPAASLPNIDFRNLTPEQRQQALEALTPEQRELLRQRTGSRTGGKSPRPAP